MKFSRFSLLVWSTLVFSSTGFVQEFLYKVQQPPMLPKTELDDNTNALVSTVPLDISLQIGAAQDKKTTNTNTILSIQRLVVNLGSETLGSPLPKTAPTPELTTYQAHLAQNGHFIDRNGLQTLDLGASPCWQLIWRDQAPAGNCVIGLDVQSSAVRNDAKLDAGTIFVSFPVWKQERLAEYQVQKEEYERAAAVHLQERDAEIEKMKETSNFLAKAWHYRNAAAAVEKYHMRPTRSLAAIPSPEDVFPISDSLLVARLGTVWRKSQTGFGMQSNEYLGTATMRAPPSDTSTTLAP